MSLMIATTGALSMSISRRAVLLAATSLATLLLAGCSGEKKLDNVSGMDLYGSGIGTGFALQGADGRQYSLPDFKGKVLLVFFGFTQCPDICPTALYRASEVKRELGADGNRLQVAFISVDPERDTPEILRAYTEAFDPSFLGLYGTPEQIAATAADFKAYYRKVPTGSSYTMDHTALSYVFDADGKLRLALGHNQPIEEFVSDIRKVMALG
ncbi:redoxin domain-containing protein [Pusillimonas sp. TS35]|nr:redoxin domain-containing protein [Pusillimonas sp. TS35]